ncbi:MAG: hypothetical protein IT442_07025 [Phycisphaeraceae bacterium]|nr:hypothetical protein [Phycisphaeraceae bacterium]
MTPQQKEGWFTLSVFLLSLATFLVTGPLVGWQKAQACFALLGLAGFTPLFYRRRDGKKPLFDERDTQIGMRAILGAWAIFWACFVLFFMGWWGWLQWHAQQTLTISIQVLPNIVIGAMILVFPLRAGLIVYQYHRQSGKNGELTP